MVVPPRQKPAQKKSKPTYDLAKVQSLVSQAIIGQTVVRGTKATCGIETEREVKGYIRDCIRTLRPDNFAYAEWQSYDHDSFWYDIYGLENDDGSWFIKFRLSEDRLTIASCHAPKRDIKCINGEVIKAT